MATFKTVRRFEGDVGISHTDIVCGAEAGRDIPATDGVDISTTADVDITDRCHHDGAASGVDAKGVSIDYAIQVDHAADNVRCHVGGQVDVARL